jgi:hypothetical protein
MTREFCRQTFEFYGKEGGGGLFHADGQTDMTKLIVSFHNDANATKKTEVAALSMFWITED